MGKGVWRHLKGTDSHTLRERDGCGVRGLGRKEKRGKSFDAFYTTCKGEKKGVKRRKTVEEKSKSRVGKDGTGKLDGTRVLGHKGRKRKGH